MSSCEQLRPSFSLKSDSKPASPLILQVAEEERHLLEIQRQEMKASAAASPIAVRESQSGARK